MKKTELITNTDGSVFHLHLLPGDIANTIIVVGDPGRVDMLAELLTDIRVRKENREFKTVTGSYGYGEVTIISSGIGTDNIDILVNELDALVNIDLTTGVVKEDPVSLRFIRLGTSGALNPSIPVGSTVLTEIAVGFDSLIHFYGGYEWILDNELTNYLTEYLEWPDTLSYPYAVKASEEMVDLFSNEDFIHGVTFSAPGFYAPQGRQLRLETFDSEINEKLSNKVYKGFPFSNYEMESSALYGLATLLGHKALTVCVVLANRVTGEFLNDYHGAIKDLAVKVLNVI